MVKRILFIISLAFSLSASAQTYTFECMDGSRLSGDSCDICPNTIIESKSFNGLVIYRDSAFYKWVDQPYSIRVKPGGLVEYWEHSVNPYSERFTIPLSLTGFFSVEGMADSTWCNSPAPNRYQYLTLDSINATQAAISITGDPTDEYLEEGTGIAFSYEGDTLTISSAGGATNLSYSIGGSPVTLFSSTGTDVGIIAGTGIGLSSTATDLTITNSAPSLWTDAGAYTYLTSTTDRAVVGSATELNTSYILQAKGGLFVQGAGSTSGTFAGVFENSSGVDILNIRNDGFVGINNSSPSYTLDVTGDVSISTTSAYRLGAVKMAYGNTTLSNYFFAGAGNTTSTADRVLGFGPQALSSSTTGALCVAIGGQALRLNTTGAQNFAIGTGTLELNVSGSQNVGIGLSVLNRCTVSGNTGVGDQVMTISTTGTKNVGIGTQAVFSNTVGSNNVGIGYWTMLNNADGSGNTAVGMETMLANVSGSNMVAVGRGALGLATATGNIGIGYNAGDNITSGLYNVVLGYNVDAPSATGNYQVSIGNIIFATNADGTGTTVSTGKVGIKTNAPSQDFHVVGNARVTGAVYDSNNDPGTNGQIMSSTVTGWDWVAAAAAYTDEQAQDAVGSILVDSPQIDFTYNDATPSITATVIDESITYAKIQNVAANNVLLGNDSGAGADVQELSTAEAQTMLGYIDGAGANQRIPYFTDANTLAAEAAFLYDAANDRQTITAATPGLGAGAAILNLTNTGPDGTGEFLQIRGDISANLLSGMTNTNTGATANTIWNVTQAGNSAGDPYIQTQISGASGNTTSFGLDNSDANKFKITPNGNAPGVNANASLVATNDAIPLWGINKDAPAFPLDVGGKDRSEQYHGVNVAWVTGDVFFGSGAGTAPTFTAMSGTHNFVKIEFSTGTSPAANNAVFSIVRKAAFEFATKGFPVFCAGNANTAGEITKFYISSDDGVTLTMGVNGTLTASTPYVFYIGFSGY